MPITTRQQMNKLVTISADSGDDHLYTSDRASPSSLSTGRQQSRASHALSSNRLDAADSPDKRHLLDGRRESLAY